jgi:DNA-binding transcriptional ArsR family regulator
LEENEILNVAHLLKTMAHPIRLKILCLLQDRERTVGELRNEVKTTNANVSQHLTILRSQGIVTSRKDANFMYNRINDPRILELIKNLRELYCQS